MAPPERVGGARTDDPEERAHGRDRLRPMQWSARAHVPERAEKLPCKCPSAAFAGEAGRRVQRLADVELLDQDIDGDGERGSEDHPNDSEQGAGADDTEQ